MGNVETAIAFLNMYDTATLVLSILGFALIWTTSIIGGVVWLSAKFRIIERAIYREDERHRAKNDAEFEEQRLRIHRLELRVFGFTETP